METHFLVLGALLLAYFAPSIVAVAVKNRQAVAIALVNLLLGWTIIGWVASLVWACVRAPVERRY